MISKNIKNKNRTKARLHQSRSILSLHKVGKYQPIIMGKYKKSYSILTILAMGLFIMMLGVLITGWYMNMQDVPEGRVLGVEEIVESVLDRE